MSGGLAEVLATHGDRLGAGGGIWNAKCLGCNWRDWGHGTMLHAANAHRAHVAAAVQDWLAARLASDEVQEAVAEAVSVRELGAYSPDAHPDHNRWTWRGDGHDEATRDEFRAVATAALTAVTAALREGAP